uniref:ABC transporter ATP-binding protein n=1 Tax=Tessaracoccus timonensis TaxID=2161816 RepID=UPI000D55C0EC|nr:ABC transporter ATP-binding protein [Tessaracoccus timonensis]
MTSSAIEMNDLTIRFGDFTAVERVSASVPKGSFSVITGPNGCGKSTLLRAVAYVRPADEGSVAMLGQDVARMGRRQLARTCSLLPQTTVTPRGLRVEELVARGRHPYHSFLSSSAPGDAEIIDRAMERAGVTDLVGRQVAELSGGQRQRVWLAMVLAQDTPVILLDEPTTFLDLSAQYLLLDLCSDLVDEGRTVVAVLHDLPQAAAYADHVLMLKQGRLVAEGPPAEVITAENVEDTYRIKCRVDLDDPRGPVVLPLARQHRLCT